MAIGAEEIQVYHMEGIEGFNLIENNVPFSGWNFSGRRDVYTKSWWKHGSLYGGRHQEL